MVGLFGDPDEGGFCHDRDVAYCSGAALMLRRAAVGDTLFDEAFVPPIARTPISACACMAPGIACATCTRRWWCTT